MLRIRKLVFAYEPGQPPVVNIRCGPYAREDKEQHEEGMQTPIPHEITIERGKIYGIVGQNRAGKSTLLQLLCKLFQPQEMDVLLDDTDFGAIPRTAVRRMISYVPQRPFIFPGTIEQNIRVGNPAATNEEGTNFDSHFCGGHVKALLATRLNFIVFVVVCSGSCCGGSRHLHLREACACRGSATQEV